MSTSVASVEEQIRLDHSLSGPLADLRMQLEGFSVGGEFDLLLKHWDAAVTSSNFMTVARLYRSLMRNILNAMAGRSDTDGVNDGSDVESTHHALLLKAAVIGFDQIASREGNPEFEDTIAELSGLIEALEVYGIPRGYLRKRESSPWLEEHYNADELTRDDPILLSEFVVDVEQFLSNLISARRHFRSPEE